MRPLLPLVLAGLAACTTTNSDHCGNQSGHQTCFERDPAAKFCDICVADNNGCVAEAPAESCAAMTAPPVETTTSATTGGPTTEVDPGTTVDPPTTTPNTGTTDDPTTGPDPTTSTTATTSTSTTTETATTATTSTSDTTTTTGDTSTGDTDSSSGTTAGPMCGNGIQEAGEKCDGADLDGVTCETVIADKWDDGTLACTATCKAFDDTDCCYQLGHLCNGLDLPNGRCCEGLKCKLDPLPSLQSHCAP